MVLIIVQAALAGNLNLSWELDELQSLSPVVRKEVLTGELGRRVKTLGTVPAADLDSVVEALVSLNLSEVVQGIHDPEKFAAQVKTATEQITARNNNVSLLESVSITVPSTPASTTAVGTPLFTPPRASSPSGSVAPISDRERLISAVSRLESDADKCGAIADLLLTLTKKERALCIFNVEYLKTKVAEAREVLEADDAEDLAVSQSVPPTLGRPSISPIPIDNGIKSVSAPAVPQSLSPAAPSIPSLPDTRSSETDTLTLTSLAALPAKEIIKLAESPSESLTGLPLQKADPLVIKATDDFVDSLANTPVQQQKQLVGEKL